MKMVPVKFYYQRAKIFFTLLGICLIVYMFSRFFIEYTN